MTFVSGKYIWSVVKLKLFPVQNNIIPEIITTRVIWRKRTGLEMVKMIQQKPTDTKGEIRTLDEEKTIQWPKKNDSNIENITQNKNKDIEKPKPN